MPGREKQTRAIARIERVMRLHGLRMVSRGTLKTYPGCTHWHYKNDDEKGTLELTLWSETNRLWFKVQSGRRAAWIDDMIRRLKTELERKHQSPAN